MCSHLACPDYLSCRKKGLKSSSRIWQLTWVLFTNGWHLLPSQTRYNRGAIFTLFTLLLLGVILHVLVLRIRHIYIVCKNNTVL